MLSKANISAGNHGRLNTQPETGKRIQKFCNYAKLATHFAVEATLLVDVAKLTNSRTGAKPIQLKHLLSSGQGLPEI